MPMLIQPIPGRKYSTSEVYEKLVAGDQAWLADTDYSWRALLKEPIMRFLSATPSRKADRSNLSFEAAVRVRTEEVENAGLFSKNRQQREARQWFLEDAAARISASRDQLPAEFWAEARSLLLKLIEFEVNPIAEALLAVGVELSPAEVAQAAARAVIETRPMALALLLRYKPVNQTVEQFLDTKRSSLLCSVVEPKSLSPHVDKILLLLLKHGVSIDAQNEFGETALHVVIRNKQAWRLIPLLLSYGASLTVKDNDEQTPLDIAREYANCTKEPDGQALHMIDEFCRRQERALHTLHPQQKLLMMQLKQTEQQLKQVQICMGRVKQPLHMLNQQLWSPENDSAINEINEKVSHYQQEIQVLENHLRQLKLKLKQLTPAPSSPPLSFKPPRTKEVEAVLKIPRIMDFNASSSRKKRIAQSG